MPSYSPEDVSILSRTIYGEARGCGFDGKTAVGWVVRNRASKGGWFGASIADVCVKPKQFSCWNDNDPNRAKLLAATITDKAFLECLSAAAAVLGSIVPDPTFGATHYHTLSVDPKWDDGKKPTVTIGQHVFYKDI